MSGLETRRKRDGRDRNSGEILESSVSGSRLRRGSLIVIYLENKSPSLCTSFSFPLSRYLLYSSRKKITCIILVLSHDVTSRVIDICACIYVWKYQIVMQSLAEVSSAVQSPTWELLHFCIQSIMHFAALFFRQFY